MGTYVREYTEVPLLLNYIEMMRFVVGQVQHIVFESDIELSCWKFIKEDYTYIGDILDNYHQRMQHIV